MLLFCISTPEGLDEEKMEDRNLFIQEIVEGAIGEIPSWMDIVIRPTASVRDGILQELAQNNYDLMIMGAGMEAFSHRYLFGALNDSLIEEMNCSMLIVRRYRPEAAIWLNNRLRRLEE